MANAKTSSAHTPAPWEVIGTSVFRDCKEYPQQIVHCAKGCDRKQQEANARHIAQCVNSHDELVEFVSQVVWEIELQTGQDGKHRFPSDIADNAFKLFAKAHGE